MRVGDLFSGIGGFSLAARWMGWRTAWFSETDPFCCRVLAKHWPGVPNLGDIRAVEWGRVEPVDVLCGGFPCQPFSSASRGRRLGTGDDRWLWPAMRDAVAALRPAWVVSENVTQLDGVGLEQVVSDLESLGYQVAPPLEIPACAIGQDHWRPRLWICGYTDRRREPGRAVHAETPRLPRTRNDTGGMGTAHGLSGKLDRHRMRALGNAIDPQIAYMLFDAIGFAVQRCGAAA